MLNCCAEALVQLVLALEELHRASAGPVHPFSCISAFPAPLTLPLPQHSGCACPGLCPPCTLSCTSGGPESLIPPKAPSLGPGTSNGHCDPHLRCCPTAGSQCLEKAGFEQCLTYSSRLQQHLHAASLAVALPQINPLSLKDAKGHVSCHISNSSVVLRPSFNTQEFTGWELVSNSSSREAA